jgi:hypothetical protein
LQRDEYLQQLLQLQVEVRAVTLQRDEYFEQLKLPQQFKLKKGNEELLQQLKMKEYYEEIWQEPMRECEHTHTHTHTQSHTHTHKHRPPLLSHSLPFPHKLADVKYMTGFVERTGLELIE